MTVSRILDLIIENLTHSDSSPQCRTDYALRSIDYDKSDILVAFRVARKEIDGSVVILWKRHERFSRPDLIGLLQDNLCESLVDIIRLGVYKLPSGALNTR